MKTYVPRASEIARTWRVLDAEGRTLGRLATRIATLLRGKHRAAYAPGADAGDAVIVVNAAKVAVTGNKRTGKLYVRHSGYPGGLRRETLGSLLARRPEAVIRRAVRRMLPDNRLGDRQIRRLFVYAGPEHPHAAQRPVAEGAKEPARPSVEEAAGRPVVGREPEPRSAASAGPGPGSDALALPADGTATRSKSKRVGVAAKALPPGRSSVEGEVRA